MPVFPCASKGLCVDPSTPFANLSAELPDSEIFVALNWDSALVPPPLNSDFTQTSCLGVCESAISQEDADLCAAQANAECTSTGTPTGTPGVDIYGRPVVIHNPSPIYRNSPQSASVLCPDGLAFIYTVPPGRFSAPSQYQANAIAKSYAQQQAAARKLCLSNLTPAKVCVNADYTGTITASGRYLAAPPNGNIWTLPPGQALPPGIGISLMDGDNSVVGPTVNVYGTPTTPGVYVIVLGVTDTLGDSMQKAFHLTVMGVSNAGALADGTVGTAYSQDVETLGVTNPIYSLDGGTLPDGLLLDPTGVIYGNPTTPGTYYFTLGVTEAGTGVTCDTAASITVIGTSFGFRNNVWGAPNYANGGPPSDPTLTILAVNSVKLEQTGAFSIRNAETGIGGNPPIAYSGPDVAGNVQVNFVNPVLDIGGGGNTLDVQVYLGQFNAPDYEFTLDAANTVSGVYNFPITINGGPGGFVYVQAYMYGVNGHSFSATTTFTPF